MFIVLGFQLLRLTPLKSCKSLSHLEIFIDMSIATVQ